MPNPVLAIGPANYAGQAFEWAEAVNNNMDASAWSFMRGPVRRNDFRFPSHKTIHPVDFYVALGRGWRSRRLLRGTTHVALDGYEAFYRWRRARTLVEDAKSIEVTGRCVALIAHGTDVRDPLLHRERLKWSFFNEGSQEWRDFLVRDTAENRQFADESGYPLFVSTPDLLLDQPSATWLPLAIEPEQWATPVEPLVRKVPRVLHIPSRRNPPIKGTQYVDPVLQDLEREGAVEYVSPASVRHDEMTALMQSCDIVIDQILTGAYGVTAVEAMAAGRVVIGGIAPDVADRMPERPGMFDADPDTLRSVMESILDDRDGAQERARAGTSFVRKWHDGRASAEALRGYLGARSSTTR